MIIKRILRSSTSSSYCCCYICSDIEGLTPSLCFDPSSPQTLEIFEEAKNSMVVAKKFFYKTREFGKAKRIQNIIEGFDKYLNYEGTEEVLTVLGGLTGDMA